MISSVSGHFNPRSREGSDDILYEVQIIGSVVFQSTLPRGERLVASSVVSTRLAFQSTLPRGERHHGWGTATPNIQISIHAPARGATQNDSCTMSAITISIHAPARGATLQIVKTDILVFEFQSTLPRGERHCF